MGVKRSEKKTYDISTLSRLMKKDFIFVIAVFLALVLIFTDISIYESFGSVRSRKLEAENLAEICASEIERNYDVENFSSLNETVNLFALNARGYNYSIYKLSETPEKNIIIYGKDFNQLHKPIIVKINIPYENWYLAVAPAGHWLNIHIVIVLATISLLFICSFTILTLLFLKLRQSNIRLAQLATLDQLTGLYTKQTAIFSLKKEIDYAKRNGSQVAVCFIDMNNFKQINDRFGHTVGDTALAKVAKRLMESVRPEDIIARFGGDEFIIIFRGKYTGTDYVSTTERIRAVLNVPAKLSARVLVDISASVGLAVYPANGSSVEKLIAFADKAMYAEKAKYKQAAQNNQNDSDVEILNSE